MVRRAGRTGAWLLWGRALRPWSLGGYGAAEAASDEEAVSVLTPHLSVAAIADGYTPAPHASAEA
jgi:hypothetical protein